MSGNAVAIIGIIILIAVGLAVGFSFLLAFLWNLVMPYLFGLPIVEWWHMLILAFIIEFLFGCIRREK